MRTSVFSGTALSIILVSQSCHLITHLRGPSSEAESSSTSNISILSLSFSFFLSFFLSLYLTPSISFSLFLSLPSFCSGFFFCPGFANCDSVKQGLHSLSYLHKSVSTLLANGKVIIKSYIQAKRNVSHKQTMGTKKPTSIGLCE